MPPDKLVYVANQVGKFFAHRGEDEAIAAIADHLVKFWDPRMRTAIVAHLAAGSAGMDARVRSAVTQLRDAHAPS